METRECRWRGRVGKLVTLPVNGAWQPTFPEQAYEGRTADFMAFPSRFAVVSGTVTMHGLWTEREDAERFARSMPWADGKPAEVRETESYWYAPAFGRVD